MGLDADHCIVKYNIVELTKLVTESGLRDLHEHCGYPAEVMDFDCNSDLMQACLNYSVFDIENGTLIKLGENKEILAALRGKEQLSD